MSRQLTVKPDTGTEDVVVNVAGISVKVIAHYPGRSHFVCESRTFFLEGMRSQPRA